MTLNNSIIEILEARYNFKIPDKEKIFREIEEFRKNIESKLEGRDFWQVSEDEFVFLFISVYISKPKIVFETGVGPGTSSSSILKALGDDSKLISFDLGVKYGNSDEMPVGFAI
ncbi:MAG: hypothetical protein ACYDDC_07550, partial [Thermoplasmataceae archaeon]